MVCPFCLHKKTNVYNSRQTTRINATWRRRRCEACLQPFTTRESADPESILTVAAGKRFTPYSRARLTMSLLRVADHREDYGEAMYWLADTIEQLLYRLSSQNDSPITKRHIIDACLKTLRNFDTIAYVKYLSLHSRDFSARTLKKHLK